MSGPRLEDPPVPSKTTWWTRLPFFYGWVLVAVTFVCFAIGYVTWGSFSIFYVALIEDFGWPRAVTAGAFSLFLITFGFASMGAGALVDRFGPRWVLPPAAVLLGVSLLLTSRMSELWQFYLLYGVAAAVGLSSFGVVPSFAVLNGWFVRKRGLASGIAVAGMGAGTITLVPLLQATITGHGWRAAYVVLASAVLVVIPALTFVFIRPRPRDPTCLPDGDRAGTRHGATGAARARADALVVDREWASRDWSLATALGTSRCWLMLAARFIELMCLQVFITHQAAFLVDAGYDRMVAASVVGTVGIVGSGAKILAGVVSDRVGREAAYTLAFIAGMAGVAVILSIRAGSPSWMPFAYAGIFGLFFGASSVLLPVLVADMYYGRRFGAILGGAYLSGGVGAAVGSFFAGYLFDLTGSYNLPFALTIPSMGLACLLYWLAAPRKVRMVPGRVKRAARLRMDPGS